jgi:hypothetical protein
MSELVMLNSIFARTTMKPSPKRRSHKKKRKRRGQWQKRGWKMQKEKYNKHILAIHGSLSQFATRNGYISSQKNAKPTPLRSKFLRTPGTPLL